MTDPIESIDRVILWNATTGEEVYDSDDQPATDGPEMTLSWDERGVFTIEEKP